MIEIVFSESAGGSLRTAQHYGEGEYPGGATAVLLTDADATEADLERAKEQVEQDERREWEQGQPMGGSPEDIFVLPLGLSMGDISEEIPGAGRRRVLQQVAGLTEDESQKVLTEGLRSLRTVLERSAGGDAVRIWYSQEPDEMSGLYWLLSQLSALGGGLGPVSTVSLPQFEQQSEETAAGTRVAKVIQRSGWSDVAPGEWQAFAGEAVPASPLLARIVARRWHQLQRENAPLRAVVNGSLVSVPAGFYDGFIYSEIRRMNNEFKEALLIGNVLSGSQLGVGDGLVALRIQAMVDAGILEVAAEAADSVPRYHRILRKRQVPAEDPIPGLGVPAKE